MNNLVLITMDCVRPDHLGCYGYKEIETPNIDRIAEEGVLFETCIATSCLTPVSHASILSGVYPPKHTVRNPFDRVGAKMISEILKDYDYKTAGFVGISFLSARHNFNAGFDYFDEPTEEEAWNRKTYKKENQIEETIWGNWWVDRMLKWLKDNSSHSFFIWGHYFKCHYGSEELLLEAGEIEEGKHSSHAYYDAKIEHMDKKLFGPLVQLLNDLKLWNNTSIVITSDHGENLGEHLAPLPYPQHRTMYDCDLKVPLIIKDERLPKGKFIKNMVRAVDLIPTLLELNEINTDLDLDGKSLVPLIEKGEWRNTLAYSEELFENRGAGSLQSIRSEEYKLIRNISKDVADFYNIQKEPDELKSIDDPNQKELEIWTEFRRELDKFLSGTEKRAAFSSEDEEKVKARLRQLGYID